MRPIFWFEEVKQSHGRPKSRVFKYIISICLWNSCAKIMPVYLLTVSRSYCLHIEFLMLNLEAFCCLLWHFIVITICPSPLLFWCSFKMHISWLVSDATEEIRVLTNGGFQSEPPQVNWFVINASVLCGHLKDGVIPIPNWIVVF